MTLNIPNIKRVRDHIAGLPEERFSMARWAIFGVAGSMVGRAEPSDLIHDCDTCGCIGGWTEALFPELTAPVALGLTEQEEDDLFYPAGFYERPDQYPQSLAVAVLDHLISTYEETGEVVIDWSVAEGVS